MKTVTFLGSALIEQQLLQVQKDLEQLFQMPLLSGDIRIQRTSKHLTIVIAEQLMFDAGSDEIHPGGVEVLKHMGILFKKAALKEIRVIGHADGASTPDPFNKYFEKLALSKARATQTVRVLKEHGADSQKFIIEWYADLRPISSNGTQERWQHNRRVEIVLYAGM